MDQRKVSYKIEKKGIKASIQPLPLPLFHLLKQQSETLNRSKKHMGENHILQEITYNPKSLHHHFLLSSNINT